MRQWAERAKTWKEPDPFVATCSGALEEKVRSKAGLKGITRKSANQGAFREPLYSQVWWAFVGGAMVIAPVGVILYFPNDRKISLGTTCAAMILFAFAIIWVPGLRLRDMLAVTAAYASVLVVFVGTNTQTLSFR